MRFLLLIVALVAILGARGARADVAPAALCRSAITAAERAFGIPDRLMQAMGVVESGRTDERGGVTAWPWTINVEGVGYVFETKQDAVAAVNAHRARGARSIDVGCMQVNLMHHGDAFSSLEQAFDPQANARYAAEFLQKLLGQTGSWPRAAAGYHSLTPDIGADYGRKVLAVWARPGLGEPVPYFAVRSGTVMANLIPPSSAFTSMPSSNPGATSPGGLTMRGSMTARILPAAAGAATVASGAANAPTGSLGTGRGLSAYRATPTRLATALPFRRG